MKLKTVAARLTLMRLMHKSEANDGQNPQIHPSQIYHHICYVLLLKCLRGSVPILLSEGSTMVERAHTFC